MKSFSCDCVEHLPPSSPVCVPCLCFGAKNLSRLAWTGPADAIWRAGRFWHAKGTKTRQKTTDARRKD
eukprot:scaffold790_cov387-Prasinococcus_capsulatus_cf.AAC.6